MDTTAPCSLTAIVKSTSERDGWLHLYGWASISTSPTGEPVVDSDGDYIPVEELEKAVHEAFLNRGGRGAVGAMHNSFNRADLTESFVSTLDKQKAFGIDGIPEGWMVGVRTRDDRVKEAVKSGRTLELSIRATGRRQPMFTPGVAAISKRQVGPDGTVAVVRDLRLSEIELLSIVDKGAGGDAHHRPRILLIKRDTHAMADIIKQRTAQVILAELFEAGKLAELPPEDKEMLLAATVGAPAPTPAPAEPEPVIKPDDEPKPESMPKADDGPRDDEVVKIAKRNVALEKRVAELETQAAHSELVDLAKRDLAYVPGASADDLASLVHEARVNLGSDTAKRLETILKASSEAIRKGGLIDVAGSRATGAIAGDGASELEQIAKSVRKTNPKLSASSALLEAGRQRPDLWASNRAKGE